MAAMPHWASKSQESSEKVGDFMPFLRVRYGGLKKMHRMTGLSELEVPSCRPLKMLPDIPASMTIKILPHSEMNTIVADKEVEREATIYEFIAEISTMAEGIPGAGRLTVTVPCALEINDDNIGTVLKQFRKSLKAMFHGEHMKYFQEMDSGEMFLLAEAKDDVQIVVTTFTEDNRIFFRFIIDSFWKPANEVFITALKALHEDMMLHTNEYQNADAAFQKKSLYRFRQHMTRTLTLKYGKDDVTNDEYPFPSIEYVERMSSLHRRAVAAHLIKKLHDIEIYNNNVVAHATLKKYLILDEKLPILSDDFRAQVNIAPNEPRKTVMTVDPSFCVDVVYSGFRHCGGYFVMYKRQTELRHIDNGAIPIFFGDIGQNCFLMNTHETPSGFFGSNVYSTSKTIEYYPTEIFWSEWNNFDPSDDQTLGMLEFEAEAPHEPNVKKGDKRIFFYQSYFSGSYPKLKIRAFHPNCNKKRSLVSLLEKLFHVPLKMDRMTLLNIKFTVFSIQNIDALTLEEILAIQTRHFRPGEKTRIQIPETLLGQYRSRAKIRTITMETKTISDRTFYSFEYEIPR